MTWTVLNAVQIYFTIPYYLTGTDVSCVFTSGYVSEYLDVAGMCLINPLPRWYSILLNVFCRHIFTMTIRQSTEMATGTSWLFLPSCTSHKRLQSPTSGSITSLLRFRLGTCSCMSLMKLGRGVTSRYLSFRAINYIECYIFVKRYALSKANTCLLRFSSHFSLSVTLELQLNSLLHHPTCWTFPVWFLYLAELIWVLFDYECL